MNTTEFGEKLSAYRQNANMTQEELALRTGVTPQAVSKWERGQSLPDISLLADLCRVLDVSADLLLDISCGICVESPELPSDTLFSFGDPVLLKQILKNLQNSMEPLLILFGEKIVPCFIDNSSYLEQLRAMRLHLSRFGYLVPVIRLRDEMTLDADEFMFVTRSRILHREHIPSPDEHTVDYIIGTFGRILKENYHYILSRDIIKALTDNLREKYPALIDGIIPEKISYGLLQDVFFRLLAQNKTSGESPCCFPACLPEVIEHTESILREQPHLQADEIAKIVSSRMAANNIWQVYLQHSGK
ncbi:MAG: helix-turn-helix domain-containing protein [Lachnospiraceae bacterium]|nr:helix-turn-helix domain-containing protein [Lachnospiraceae bacterium]